MIVKRIWLLFGILPLFFVSCGPSEPEIPETKAVEQVTKEPEILPAQYEVDRLLARAREEIEKKQFDAARKTIDAILSQYPETKEAEAARALLATLPPPVKKSNVPLKAKPAKGLMRAKFDPKTGITWYKDENTPVHNTINSIYLYFGKKKNEPPFLRFRIRYCSDAWLYIMSYIVMADRERFVQPMVSFKRLHSENRYQELYDEPVTPKLFTMLNKIAKSERSTIRLHGQKGVGDVMLTQEQKKSMRNVLAAFEKMKRS